MKSDHPLVIILAIGCLLICPCFGQNCTGDKTKPWRALNASETTAESQARTLLPSGITVNNSEACPDDVRYQAALQAGHRCTSIRGLLLHVIPALTNLQKEFGSNISITGGTECGHVEHVDNQTVDIVAADFESLKRFVGFYGALLPNFPQPLGTGHFQFLGMNARLVCDDVPPYDCKASGNFAFSYGLSFSERPRLDLEGSHYKAATASEHLHIRFSSTHAATVTTSKAGSGQGTISTSPAPCGAAASNCSSFTRGVLISVHAQAAPDSIFTAWTGVDQANGSRGVVKLTSNHHVVASSSTTVHHPITQHAGVGMILHFGGNGFAVGTQCHAGMRIYFRSVAAASRQPVVGSGTIPLRRGH